MSLFDTLSSVHKYSPFGGSATSGWRPLWGKVISNEDPKMLGRVKVAFKELMPWSEREGKEAGKEVLPWIYPLYPAGLGQGPLSTYFCVPEEETFVLCVFPYNSIYMGYYIGHTTDRLRRQVDFLSEYPERYGWQDSQENKRITNKDPDVNTIEQRYADSGLSVYDSRQSQFTFTDQHGTSVFIDRKTQYLSIKFGGVHFQIIEGTLKVDSDATELNANVLKLMSQVLSLISTQTHISGGTLSVATDKHHDPQSRTLEKLDRN